MSIKDLFNKKVNSISTNSKTIRDYEEVESLENVNERTKEEIRFSPQVDFEDPSQFANYGLAERYYVEAIEHIYKTYPYDGSFYERQKWHNESSDLVNYFFENKFPRNNGFINFGQNYNISSNNDDGYYDSDNHEYIFFKGTYNDGNIHDIEKNREYNLKIDGEEGNTIEFYFRREDLLGSEKQVVLDIWNNEEETSDSYGRIIVEMHPGIVGEEDKLYLSIVSGSSTSNFELGNNLGFLQAWHHYAISYKNSGNSIEAVLLVDGDVVDKKIAGSSIGRIYGGMRAHIGSLIAPKEGTSTQKGWGKLSGSLDEFRFWKKKKTDKDIALNYFTHVAGGVNSDDSNTDLGVYYKFNEGIYNSIDESHFDKIVLDYSGRISNGSWTGYTLSSRNTGSAIVLGNFAKNEFKDPIVYGHHGSITSLKESYKEIGYEYDIRNGTNLYNSLPNWKIDEDQQSGKGTQDLMQIISEIFDELHNKIKSLPTLRNIEYRGEPIPFATKLIENFGFDFADIFSNADVREIILDRNDFQNYESKIYKVKNIIYQNIYNNLTNIYKTKGTTKSFRNLLHCFGVGEELLKFQMYADGQEYEIKNRFRNSMIKRTSISFNNTGSYGGVIWQKRDVSDSKSIGYLKPSSDIKSLGSTLEVELFFPKKFELNDPLYYPYNYHTSSLFGIHEQDNEEWAINDRVDLQVFAVRENFEDNDVYFLLSSSYLGINERTAKIFDVYEDKKWNISLKIKPERYPLSENVNGTSGDDYVIELYGSSHVQDIKENFFKITSSLNSTLAHDIFDARKVIYVGAHRNNFSEDVISIDGQEKNKQYSDIELFSVRYWNSFLSDETIDLHSKVGNNYGAVDREHSTAAQNLAIQNSLIIEPVEQNRTLSLHWNYLNPSIENGEFKILDASSGSLQNIGEDFISKYTQSTFTAAGKHFSTEQNNVNLRYINSTELENPDSISPDDLVQILSEYDDLFEKEKRFVEYHFSLEKSLYNTISKEMINWLGTAKEYNNIIGEPQSRYEENYRGLEKLRYLFFRNVESEPDYDSFIEFYKWIDNSITYMIEKLIPASMNFVPSVMNVVESHAFERNKYRHKLPTIEFAGDPKIPSIKGLPSLLYNWRIGHAPMPLVENKNCFWWLTRVEREGELNPDRQGIFEVFRSGINRKYDSHYVFTEDAVTITGRKQKADLKGTLLTKKSQQDIIINEIGFGLSGTEVIEITDNVPSFLDCDDE